MLFLATKTQKQTSNDAARKRRSFEKQSIRTSLVAFSRRVSARWSSITVRVALELIMSNGLGMEACSNSSRRNKTCILQKERNENGERTENGAVL